MHVHAAAYGRVWFHETIYSYIDLSNTVAGIASYIKFYSIN